MDYVEKTINKNYIFKGKILTLRCDDAELPDGKPCTREVIEHSGGACVLYVKDEKVLLVRQYRYPMEKVTLEIPAGKLDTPEEDRLEAAKRELREETGAVAESIICLGDFYGSPAFVDEKITMYAASGLSFGETELDDGEFLTTVKMPLSDAVELVMDGKIEDVKTQAAILRAHLMREQGRL